MTVVVMVPGQGQPWQVANSAFRLLVDELLDLQPPATEREAIMQAQALQLLDLTAMTGAQRDRLARLLAESARRLRHRLLLRPAGDLWEAEFTEALAELAMWMEGLTNNPAGETR